METQKLTPQTNEIFSINNSIWKILIATSFLNISFEKFYKNFIKNNDFEINNFEKSIEYVLNLIWWENYKFRLSNLDKYEKTILNILNWNLISCNELNESMLADIVSIIWKKDDFWLLDLDISDIDFIDEVEQKQIVKNGIIQYIKNQKTSIKQAVFSKNFTEIQNDLHKKIKEVLSK